MQIAAQMRLFFPYGIFILVGVFLGSVFYGIQATAHSAVILVMIWTMSKTCWRVLSTCFSMVNLPKRAKKKNPKGSICTWLSAHLPLGRSFDDKLHDKLALLRYAFTVALTRGDGDEDMKIGLRLCGSQSVTGTLGLEVMGIMSGSLIDKWNNAKIDGRTQPYPVAVGDLIVKVNSQVHVEGMMEQLTDSAANEVVLHLSRIAQPEKHYILWEVELDRRKLDESWGMELSPLVDLDGFAVGRVFAGGVVSRRNRRAAQRYKKTQTIYPGDWILACQSSVTAHQFLDLMRSALRLRLILCRWLSPDTPRAEAPIVVTTACNVDSNGATQPKGSDVSLTPVHENEQRLCDQPQVPLGPQCSCCGQASKKYVVLRCTAGEVLHWRSECWRKTYGGFAHKYAPSHCTCGACVESIEVHELLPQMDEARLVHTIRRMSETERCQDGHCRCAATVELSGGSSRRRVASSRQPARHMETVPEPSTGDAQQANPNLWDEHAHTQKAGHGQAEDQVQPSNPNGAPKLEVGESRVVPKDSGQTLASQTTELEPCLQSIPQRLPNSFDQTAVLMPIISDPDARVQGASSASLVEEKLVRTEFQGLATARRSLPTSLHACGAEMQIESAWMCDDNASSPVHLGPTSDSRLPAEIERANFDADTAPPYTLEGLGLSESNPGQVPRDGPEFGSFGLFPSPSFCPPPGLDPLSPKTVPLDETSFGACGSLPSPNFYPPPGLNPPSPRSVGALPHHASIPPHEPMWIPLGRPEAVALAPINCMEQDTVQEDTTQTKAGAMRRRRWNRAPYAPQELPVDEA